MGVLSLENCVDSYCLFRIQVFSIASVSCWTSLRLRSQTLLESVCSHHTCGLWDRFEPLSCLAVYQRYVCAGMAFLLILKPSLIAKNDGSWIGPDTKPKPRRKNVNSMGLVLIFARPVCVFSLIWRPSLMNITAGRRICPKNKCYFIYRHCPFFSLSL